MILYDYELEALKLQAQEIVGLATEYLQKTQEKPMNFEVFLTGEAPREHSVAIFEADSEEDAKKQAKQWLVMQNLHKTFTVAETNKKRGWWAKETQC